MISIFNIFGIKIKRIFCGNSLKRIIDKLRYIFMDKATVRFASISKADKHIFGLFVIADLKTHVSKIISFKLINCILRFQSPEIVSGTIILGLKRARVNNRLLLSFL